MARRLNDSEISQLLGQDFENDEDDVVFDESGAESDHVSVARDSDDTDEEAEIHNIPTIDSDDSDDEMSQPLSNFAHRLIYKGKDY